MILRRSRILSVVLALACAGAQPAAAAHPRHGTRHAAEPPPAAEPAPAPATDPSLSQALDNNRAALQKIESDLKQGSDRSGALKSKADELGKELGGLREVLVQATDAAQKLERELANLQATLAGLEKQTATREAELGAKRQQMAQLLAGLQRLARVPNEALLAKPDLPNRTVRSALVLRAMLPRIEAKANEVKAAVADLDALRARTEKRRGEVEQARADLSLREREIADMVQRREELYASTRQQETAETGRAQDLADKAQDLRDLLASIESQQQAASAQAEAQQQAEAEADARATERLRRKLGRVAAAKPPPLPAQRLAGGTVPPPADAQPGSDSNEDAQAVAEAQADDSAGADSGAGGLTAARMASLAIKPDAPGSPEIQQASVTTEIPGDATARSDGDFRLPVEGSIALHFGDPDDVDLPSQGVTLQGRAGAPVVAPLDGEVVFTGPFRGYGQMVIIKHSATAISTIARVGRVTTKVGRHVLAGEPIATVGADASGPLDLYYELRRNGVPIDPQKVIAAAADKRQG